MAVFDLNYSPNHQMRIICEWKTLFFSLLPGSLRVLQMFWDLQLHMSSGDLPLPQPTFIRSHPRSNLTPRPNQTKGAVLEPYINCSGRLGLIVGALCESKSIIALRICFLL